MKREDVLALETFTWKVLAHKFECTKNAAYVMCHVLHKHKLVHIVGYEMNAPVYKVGPGEDAYKPAMGSRFTIQWPKTIEGINDKLDELLNAEGFRYETNCRRFRDAAEKAKKRLMEKNPKIRREQFGLSAFDQLNSIVKSRDDARHETGDNGENDDNL